MRFARVLVSRADAVAGLKRKALTKAVGVRVRWARVETLSSRAVSGEATSLLSASAPVAAMSIAATRIRRHGDARSDHRTGERAERLCHNDRRGVGRHRARTGVGVVAGMRIPVVQGEWRGEPIVAEIAQTAIVAA
jgi:hypothetical protein